MQGYFFEVYHKPETHLTHSVLWIISQQPYELITETKHVELLLLECLFLFNVRDLEYFSYRVDLGSALAMAEAQIVWY